MKLQDPEIRERRFKMELFELNEQLELKHEGDDEAEKESSTTEQPSGAADNPSTEKPRGKVLDPLCELVSFTANFSLNSIPSALVVPAVGTEMISGAETLKYSKLQQLALDSKPVGVYLTVMHRTRSSRDDNEQDIQYWPEKCCIFKGYLQPPSFEVSAYGAGRSITIWHWLSALANISLLTTACSVGNPIETSMQSYHFEPAVVGNVWHPTLIGTVALSNIWEEGIKKLYLELISWGDRTHLVDKYNNFVATRRKRLVTVINKITQEGEVNASIQNGADYINRLIASDIKRDSMSSFVQTDGWSKLISDYFPAYLLSIVPRVDSAVIIPVPCTVNKDYATVLERSDIFSIKASPFIAKKVSRITCVAAESPNNNNKIVGTPHYVGLGVYPPLGIAKEGLNVTIGFPNWITAPLVSRVPESTYMLNFFDNPKNPLDENKNKDEVVEELNKIQTTVGQQYAQVAYLTQTYNNTFVRITMPVSMELCPGAMVKVYLDYANTKAWYGTVASVDVNFTSGNSTPNTVLTLTNVRDDTSIESVVDNPQKNVGFYNEQWAGFWTPLYAN